MPDTNAPTRSDIVTPPPSHVQQATATLPQGVSADMVKFLDDRVDEKIRQTLHDKVIMTREEAELEHRKQRNTKIAIGVLGFGAGIAATMIARRLRGSDVTDDEGGEDEE